MPFLHEPPISLEDLLRLICYVTPRGYRIKNIHEETIKRMVSAGATCGDIRKYLKELNSRRLNLL